MSSSFVVWFLLAWLAGFALIIGILLLAFRRRPQRPGWHAPVPDAAAPVSPVGLWNAEVVPTGGFGISGRMFGTFRLEQGMLSFTPDDAPGPLWTVPCHHLSVARRSFFALDGADLQLAGPMGEWSCSVSEEHINRFSQNTAKDFRERQYAAQFIALLGGHGARVTG